MPSFAKFASPAILKAARLKEKEDPSPKQESWWESRLGVKAFKGLADVTGKVIQGYHGLQAMRHEGIAKGIEDESRRPGADKAYRTKEMVKKSAEHSEKARQYNNEHKADGEAREQIKKEAGKTGDVIARVGHALNPVDTLSDIGVEKKSTAGIPGAIGDAAANMIPAAKFIKKAKTVVAPLVSSTIKRFATKKVVGEATEETVRAASSLSEKLAAARKQP